MKPRFCATGSGKLAYNVYGAPDAPDRAIFFHGHPGSRVQGALLHQDALREGFAVAAFDRAGIGDSDFFRESAGGPLDLSGALLALADELGWDRFHLIAVSGGAPYALNSLPGLGKRALSATLVCGLGPLAETRFRQAFPRGPLRAIRLAAWLPLPALTGLLRLALRALRALPSAPGRRRPPFLSPADFALLRAPGVGAALRASLEGAFRQGAGGAQRDLRAYQSPWTLDYQAIECPVFFWHGTGDRLVPPSTSEWLAARIPHAKLHLLNEGHYTLPLTQSGEILQNIPRSGNR